MPAKPARRPRAGRELRARAFAKINLSLRVLGRRRDGYHELRTIFQSLALHDTLRVRPSRGAFAISADDPACPADATNLVWRAADHLWAAAGRKGAPGGVAVRIVKRIPMQAGLGGGSSDAAAALRALAAWWRIALPTDRLRGVAAELGADVSYFLEGGTSLGVERGDVLYPLIDLPPAWAAIVVPSFGVSTADAYGWFDQDSSDDRYAARSVARRDQENDLEAPVAARHPEIGRLIRALTRAGAFRAGMSGSGSAVFGLFTSQSKASIAAKTLARPGRSIVVTRTLNRAMYQTLSKPRSGYLPRA
jgi:4-diphosphocytidyl-2-C-methyl-D-erythritol kinase